MTTGRKHTHYRLRKLFSSLWNRQKHLFLTVIGLSFIITLLLFIGYSEIPFQPSRQPAGRERNQDADEAATELKEHSIFMKPTVKNYLLPVVSLHTPRNSYMERTERQVYLLRHTKRNVSSGSILIKEKKNYFSGKRNNTKQYFTERAKLCSYSHYCSEWGNSTGRSNNQELHCANNSHAFSLTPRTRLVHFDLKGAPPKVDFFLKILPLLKRSGATGILIEYEDMFPYWGTLAPLAALNSYSVSDVRQILRTAKLLELEVIPLVQTFGHLEFVLKLPQFMHLRETNDSASALCPLNSGSFPIIARMIDQVMSLHPDSKWLHIGCDEVFQLGICNKCNKYIYKKDILFLRHVAKVARYVKKKFNVMPIIWDDMIRRISSHVLRNTNIGSFVEPMVWVYGEKVESLFFPRMWQRYRLIFSNLWTASAFKGAFGRNILIPNSKRHLNNHISWLSAMARYKTIHFNGIALTGWQRYEHFAPLCELFPVGIPSLVLNLLTVSQGCFTNNVVQRFQNILECKKLKENDKKEAYTLVADDPYLKRLTRDCSFPGSDVFYAVQRILNYNKTLYNLVENVCKYKFNGIIELEDKSKSKYLTEIMFQNISLQSLAIECRQALSTVFDAFVTSEWVEQILQPFAIKLEKMWSVVHDRQLNSTKLCEWNDKISYIRKFPIEFAKIL